VRFCSYYSLVTNTDIKVNHQELCNYVGGPPPLNAAATPSLHHWLSPTQLKCY